MPYSAFFERFKEIAERETRSLVAFNHPKLPPGTYALVELCCDEPGCDCRRVFLNVFRTIGGTRSEEATIAYGWESRSYYVKWMGDDDPLSIDQLMGPVLNLGSRETALSDTLLEEVKLVLKDPDYVERLKHHYAMFRETVEAGSKVKPVVREDKVARNDPCPCGSGKKYKKCHGAM